MSTDRFTEAMGYIDDDLISDAVTYMPKKKEHKFKWMKLVAAAACICLVVGLSVPGLFKNPSVGGLESNTTITDAKPEEGFSNHPLPGGIIAEVTELIDEGSCRVVVTGKDGFFTYGDTLTICYDFIQENSEETDKQLELGDMIVVTYAKYEEKDGAFYITVPYVSLIEPTE